MSNTASQNWFDQTPDCAYIRTWQLIGCKKKPYHPKLVPICRATLWRWVKQEKFPAPIKLGSNTTVWLCRDIRKWLKEYQN